MKSNMATATQKAPSNKIDLNEVEKGDVFSETSHYIYQGKSGNSLTFKHLGSGQDVTLNSNYVQDLLQSADVYQEEVKVGKEDKFWTAKQIADANNPSGIEVGDVRVAGIRTIWENITTSSVFTVVYEKAPKVLSATAFNKLVSEQLYAAISKITAAQKNKKGVADEATKVIKEIQNNPILQVEKGELRTLRGYKTQFSSRDGKYNCLDMDINETRPVNINTIVELVYNGKKYVVEQ